MDKIKPKELPEYYYWDYFGFILNFINKHYLSLLSEGELHFLHLYESLSFEGQCLFIRLSARKPIWFHQQKITYNEIHAIENAFQELKSHGFLLPIHQVEEEHVQDLVLELNKDELYQMLRFILPDQKPSKSAGKEELIQLVKEFSSNKLFEALKCLFPDFIYLNVQQEFDFLQFLFFGSKSRDLTDFVVKDLGYRQFFDIKEDEFIPYFTNREVALEKWKISNWNERFFEETKTTFDPYCWIDSWKEDILPLLPTISDLSIGSFERSVFNLGRALERNAYVEEALEVYEYGLGSKCLERRIRILAKLKRSQEAIQWARLGLELFHHPNDRHFYEDYLARIQPDKTVKQVTQKLKKAESIEIIQDISLSVEQQVAQYYHSLGYQAVFTENTLWKNIMGLLTWEIIFNAQHQQFSHPFQYAPTQYRVEGFGLENLSHFHQKLSLLSDHERLWAHFEWIKSQHEGTMNPLIDWEYLDLELIKVFLERTSVKSISAVFEQLWINIATHSKGFPDLMVWNDEELFFVEVKSPNDHLSPIQFFWDEVLNHVGIHSKILRIKWKKN
ncbi:MAG: DNA-directed polymerase [Bacteroidota bacterium]